MIDLHSHLLHGVDDGAQDIASSLALLRCAIDDGISHITLTPHIHPGRYENNAGTLEGPFSELKQQVADQGLAINLALAGEVRLSPEILTLVATKQVPFLGNWQGKNVMLLELPHGQIPPGSDKLIDWLLARDILPMIAHPERNKVIMADITKLHSFVTSGCLLQLTAMSVTGDFGEAAYNTAQKILEADWATIVASDAHNLKHRPPVLSRAYSFVSDNYGEQIAKRLMVDNPQLLVSTGL